MVRHRSRKLFLIASAAMLIAQPQASGQLVGRHHHEHYVGNVSCAIGNCPTNVLTYGYFRENWRRWPEETPEPQSRALTPFVIPDRVPFKPIIPDARDEASQRIRNRQPIQAGPEDASTGFSPRSSAPSTDNSQQNLDFDTLPDDTTVPDTTVPDITLPGDTTEPATEATPAPGEPTTPATDDDIFGSPDPLPETPAETEDEDEFDLDSLDLGEKRKRRDRITSLNENDGVGGNVRPISAEVEIPTTTPATPSLSKGGSPQFAPTEALQPLHPSTHGTPQQGQRLHPSQSIQRRPVTAQPTPFAAQPQVLPARPTALTVQPQPYIAQPVATAVQPQRFVGQPIATAVQPQRFVGQPVATAVQPQSFAGQPAAALAHQATTASGQPNQLTTVDARPLGQVHHQVSQFDPRRNPLRFQETSGTTEPVVSQPVLNQPAVARATPVARAADSAPAQAAQVTAVEKVTVEIKEVAPQKVRPRISSGRRNPLRQR